MFKSVLFVFGYLLGCYHQFKPFSNFQKRYLLSLFFPFPLSFFPIFLKIFFERKFENFLLFPYQIVSFVCLIRDMVEAKIYLPYFNPLYNLPLLFIFLGRKINLRNPVIELIIKLVVISGLLFWDCHPSWLSFPIMFVGPSPIPK
jgi:hypothetical protein